MSDENASQEEAPDTSTETDDAPVSAEIDAPEAEEATPTEKSDAESEEATVEVDPAEISAKLAAAEKKLARTSYEGREARRREAQLMSMLEQSTKTTKEASQEPKIDDFETLDEYIDARYKFLSKEPAPEPTNGNEAVFNQKRDDLMFEGAGKYEDFAEKVQSQDVVMTPVMADAIFELDDMDTQVELTYSLASNPREAMRIARLSPLRQAAEIGKLEAKLSNPKTVKKQPSNAPKPMNTVGGSKTTSSEIGDVEEYESFLQKRNKQLGRG